MRFHFLILSFVFLISSCNQSRKVVNSISCPSTFNLQYDNTTSMGVMAKRSQKKVTIFFLNYFNNRIKAFINGDLQFNDVVVTNNVSGKSNKSFSYDYSNDGYMPILRVEIEKGNCFDIQMKKKYKLIYIFYDSSKNWTVRFSNKYYVAN